MLPACTNTRCNQSLKRIYMVWLSHSSEEFYNGLCIKLKSWTVFLVLFKISSTLKPVILYLILNKHTTTFCLLCPNCVPNPTFEKRKLTCTVQWHPLWPQLLSGVLITHYSCDYCCLVTWSRKFMQLTCAFREEPLTVALQNFGNWQGQLLLETNWPIRLIDI